MEIQAGHSIAKQIQPGVPFSVRPKTRTQTKPLQVSYKIRTSDYFEEDEWSPKKNERNPSLVMPKRARSNLRPTKPRRRLITLSTSSDAKWNENWTSEYVFSLADLNLGDLAEDGHEDAAVCITLAVEKHASFGFSVHGRIIASLARKCVICSCSYCREINTTFDVWVLQSTREKHSLQLPDIGGDDPSVIYVKPGREADLDSLIQETIRLTTSVKETCSEMCDKSEQIWQCNSTAESKPSVDRRWATLLKLKKKVI